MSLHTHTHACTHTHMHCTRTCMYTRVCAHTCTHFPPHTRACTHKHTHTHMHTHTHTHTHKRTHTPLHTHTRTHAYTGTRTHEHTHTFMVDTSSLGKMCNFPPLSSDFVLSFTAVATVTALPNGHILGYGEGGVTQGGPMGMRPVYPRTQYNTQYTGAQPPRVHAGDIPHSTQSESWVLSVCALPG